AILMTDFSGCTTSSSFTSFGPLTTRPNSTPRAVSTITLSPCFIWNFPGAKKYIFPAVRNLTPITFVILLILLYCQQEQFHYQLKINIGFHSCLCLFQRIQNIFDSFVRTLSCPLF